MIVRYDEEVDALYLKFSDLEPDGVVEVSDGVNLDTTEIGKLAGIEILDVSKKMNVNTILSYALELNQGIWQKTERLKAKRKKLKAVMPQADPPAVENWEN